MKHTQAKLIFAGVISAAAIAVALDHNRQQLPIAEDLLASQQAVIIIDEGEAMPAENNDECSKPVASSRSAAPCSL